MDGPGGPGSGRRTLEVASFDLDDFREARELARDLARAFDLEVIDELEAGVPLKSPLA